MSDLKVEILLPLRYNEDRNGKRKKIEGEKYSQTFDELAVRFGGCTIDNSPLLGGWLIPQHRNRSEMKTVRIGLFVRTIKETNSFFMN